MSAAVEQRLAEIESSIDELPEKAEVATEFLSGQRLDRNGEEGTASQFQFGTRFRF